MKFTLHKITRTWKFEARSRFIDLGEFMWSQCIRQSLVFLGSEIPSGMCAKLRTVAASNNKKSCAAISLTIACSRYIYNGVILHAHAVRGESHNQRKAAGELSWVYLAKVTNFKDEKEIIAIAKTPGHRKKRKVIESLPLDWSINVHSKPNLHQIG